MGSESELSDSVNTLNKMCNDSKETITQQDKETVAIASSIQETSEKLNDSSRTISH